MLKKLILFSTLFFVFGCATIIENPKVVTAKSANCMLIEEKLIQNFYFSKNDFVNDVKQQAPEASTEVIIQHKYSPNQGENNHIGNAFYYRCFSSYNDFVGFLNRQTSSELQILCTKNTDVCKYGLDVAVKAKDFSNIIFFNRALCLANETKSCEWLKSFRTWVQDLKTKCIKRDAASCLTASVMADFDNDSVLMMTFLKQGCGYNHAESCFYYNLELEMREKRNSHRT